MFQSFPPFGQSQTQAGMLLQQLQGMRQQQVLPFAPLRPVSQQQSFPPVVLPDPPADPATYVFTQVAPATVWTITHNLSTFPSVTLVDTVGNVIQAQVQYISSNQVVATFSTPVAGSAYLNY